MSLSPKKYLSNYDIAHAVHKHIISQLPPVRHLYLRPLNLYKPRTTSWWLVPSPRLPIFQYSKLFFHRQPAIIPGMLAGLSFERGIGRQLENLVDPVLIMQNNWYWRRLVNDIIAGLYSEPIQLIKNKSQTSLKLLVELYTYNRLQRRTLETMDPDDMVMFRFDDVNHLMIEHQSQNHLQSLNQVKRFYDLVLNIEMDHANAFYYFRITLAVEIFPDRALDGQRLWEDILAPWLPLIR